VKGPDGYYFALPRQMNMAVAPNSISMTIPSIVDVSMSAATVQITAASGKGRYVTVDAAAIDFA
jgi:hypothetical protein